MSMSIDSIMSIARTDSGIVSASVVAPKAIIIPEYYALNIESLMKKSFINNTITAIIVFGELLCDCFK